jgi:PAS domain S-box-containing protein
MTKDTTKLQVQPKLPGKEWWRGYPVAIALTLTAILVRWSLGKVFNDLPDYFTFYPAVFATALIGGTRAGLLATILSVAAIDYLFLEPVGKWTIASVGEGVGMALFVAFNVATSIFAGRFRIKSKALQESEARLQIAHQAAHIGAFVFDLKTGVNTWTPELQAMYGLKPGEFAGTQSAWEQLVHPEDRVRALAVVDRAFRTLQPEEGEWRVVWPDGSIHWIIGRFQVFKDHTGKPRRLAGINIDLTERKQVEDAVHESARRFRALVTASSHAIFRMTPDWGEMHQLRGRDFVTDIYEPGRRWVDKIPAEDRERVLAAIDEAIRTKSVFDLEHRVRRLDGTPGWAASRAVPLLDADGKIIEWLGTATDITTRKEAEEAVRQSEERFRTMANAIPQLAWIAQADGSIFWFNRRWYDYTNTTPEQMKGWGWQSVHDTRILPTVLERWRHSIATGEPFEMEFPLRGADGQFRTFLARTMPLKSADGKVSLWFGTNTDITAQKQAQESLREAMAELEHMSYSMVHDMRAPLRAMQSFAELLQNECAEQQPPTMDYLRRIRESARRLDQLITDALNYNKVVRENLPITPVDLGGLLRGMVQTYPNLNPPAVEIRLEFSELMILGNRSLLTQCFGNLLDNAVKFVARDVKPCIRVWAEPATINHQPATAIYIQDNGIGIPKFGRENIFRMFHRMHSGNEYPGTGIGLTIVRKAVERMNGHITFESEPGHGTRFCVALPCPVEVKAHAPAMIPA